MNENKSDVLIDLLIKRATQGLSEAETTQLRELERVSGDLNDNSFDLAVSAIGLIDAQTDERLPADLHSRIVADADEFFAVREKAAASKDSENKTVYSPARGSWRNWLGWTVAAAACIALAVNVWLTRIQPPSKDLAQVQTTPTPLQATPTPLEVLNPAQARQRLLETATDITRASVGAGNVKALKDISGDIVWSDSKQAGYMRFRGLPPNDKNKETYQLWIFDETQDPKTPIDGGTFDIDENGEVVIPIQARLRARRPTAFAVTVEKPGGVVVSKQEKVVALAKTQA